MRKDFSTRSTCSSTRQNRSAADPDAVLTAFLQSTYEAAADAAGWGRAVLECAPGQPGKPRPV